MDDGSLLLKGKLLYDRGDAIEDEGAAYY